MFRIETHAHTAETSRCGRVPAAELVRQLQKGRFDGVVITDHFSHYYLDGYEGDWEAKVRRYFAGYEAAKAAGEEIGFRVYCGMEFRTLKNENDYLIYGVTPDRIAAHPDLHRESVESMRHIADREGWLIVQAHPFRDGMEREDPKLLDGVEVFNGNPRYDAHNERALAFAREHSLLCFSGTDYHHVEDYGRGGMVLPREPKDEADLVRLLPKAGLLPDILKAFFPVKED